MQLDNSKVTHVYSGIDGQCCCGCSGKYTYAKGRFWSVDPIVQM